TFSVGRHPADGLLSLEIDGVDIPLGVTGWSLDAGREGIFRRQWPGYEQRFFGSPSGLLQLSTGQKQSSECWHRVPAAVQDLHGIAVFVLRRVADGGPSWQTRSLAFNSAAMMLVLTP